MKLASTVVVGLVLQRYQVTRHVLGHARHPCAPMSGGLTPIACPERRDRDAPSLGKLPVVRANYAWHVARWKVFQARVFGEHEPPMWAIGVFMAVWLGVSTVVIPYHNRWAWLASLVGYIAVSCVLGHAWSRRQRRIDGERRSGPGHGVSDVRSIVEPR